MSQESIKLHLGCGHKLIPGYVNVDKFGEPDVRVDLEEFPWPWEDNSVEEVLMHHVLEHLGQETDVYLGIIKELYRVCKKDAIIKITVPHPRNDNFIIDPTHVRAVTPEGLTMFSKKANQIWKENGCSNTSLAMFLDIDLEVIGTTYVPAGVWSKKWVDGEITQEELNDAGSKFNNVWEEIHIDVKVVK